MGWLVREDVRLQPTHAATVQEHTMNILYYTRSILLIL